MTPKSKTIVFFGNERLATGVSTTCPTLRALINHGYDVAAVVVHSRPMNSRGGRLLEIEALAKAHDIPILSATNLKAVSGQLASYEAQAGILVAFGQIIPADIIDIFHSGIINIHPSLLPKYRGPTPIETAILEAANQTGLSLMGLSPKMDAGPVYAQTKVSLNHQTSKQELANKLATLGSQLLVDNLTDILSGRLIPKAQIESEASYTKQLTKADGLIDWDKPAVSIERQIRAYAGWPRSYTQIAAKNVIVTEARVTKNQTDGALVMKANPGWLEVLELIGPSGKTMSGADFLRGYKKS